MVADEKGDISICHHSYINMYLHFMCISLSLSGSFIKVPMLDTAAGGPISSQCCVINKEHIRERERERD